MGYWLPVVSCQLKRENITIRPNLERSEAMQMEMFAPEKTVHSVSEITAMLKKLIEQHLPFSKCVGSRAGVELQFPSFWAYLFHAQG